MSTLAGGLTAPRPALRPLALPTEHGGWGFLFEPLLLGLAVSPSPGGAWLAAAFVLAFLARQPLRLALQDLLRGRSYPRTAWCWLFAATYTAGAAGALAVAVAVAGTTILLPLAVAAPLGAIQIVFDARNRSRALLPELAGATAMSSSAAAIGIAGGMNLLAALGLSAVIVARAVPAIVYVRALLARSHGQAASSAPAVAVHLLAVTAAAALGSTFTVVAMVILLFRAVWQLGRPVPRAQTIGWTEVAFGLLTVTLAAVGYAAR